MPIDAKQAAEGVGLLSAVIGFFVGVATFFGRYVKKEQLADCQKNFCGKVETRFMEFMQEERQNWANLREELAVRDNRTHERIDDIYTRLPKEK